MRIRPFGRKTPGEDGEHRPAVESLASWKEIADYLGVAVRTAQKWEFERNLPVRHLPGLKGRVSADRTELEQWRQQAAQRPPWHRRIGFLRDYAAVTTMLLTMVSGIEVVRYARADRPGPAARIHIDLNALTVVDEQGRALWTKTFPEPLLAGAYTATSLAIFTRTWFGDIDHDGAADMLFTYEPVEGHGIPALFAFSERGAEKWKFAPGDRIRDGQPLSPLVTIRDFAVADLDGDGSTEIVLTIIHPSLRKSQVAVLDATGRFRGEYWVADRLEHIAARDRNHDGAAEIYAAGTSLGRGGAVLLMLDGRKLLHGVVPQRTMTGGGAQRGIERASLVFPRTCIRTIGNIRGLPS
jgi:hypothetical protein